MERKHICCICGGNNFVKDMGELCINGTKKYHVCKDCQEHLESSYFAKVENKDFIYFGKVKTEK